MTDSPIQDAISDAHDNLKAGIDLLIDCLELGKSIPPEIHKAMHALSYAVQAAENLPPASVRESIDSTPSAPASAVMRHSAGGETADAKAEPLREEMAKAIEHAWDVEPTPFNRADVAVRTILALAPPAVDDLDPVRVTLRLLADDLRSTAIALGDGDDLGAVLTGYANAAATAFSRNIDGKFYRLPTPAVDRAAVIEAAAREVVKDYPCAAGTLRSYISMPEDGYGSIKALRLALADAKGDGK